MKTRERQTEKDIKFLDFELLNNEQLSEVRGGGRPRTKDKDVFDLEEE